MKSSREGNRAVTPRLLVDPIDNVIYVFRILLAPADDVAFGIANATGIHVDDGVSSLHPFCRVRGLADSQ